MRDSRFASGLFLCTVLVLLRAFFYARFYALRSFVNSDMRISYRLASTIALLFCAITASNAQRISLPEEFRPQQFDVVSYTADIHIETVTNKQIRGVVRMAVRWTSPSSTPALFVHLLGCTLDSATVRSQRVTPVPSAAAVTSTDTMRYFTVTLPHNVAENDVDTLVMFYSGTMTNEGGGVAAWGGVHYDDEVLYALGVGFRAPQVSTTQHWMPCYDHPSDKALFNGSFNVPVGFDVASVGTRTNDTVIATRRIVEWKTRDPLSTYLLTFAVAPYALLRSSEGNTPIEIYTLPVDTTSARISFRALPRMIRTLSELYGPYPFEKVGYCATRRGAMEHATMVSYPVSLIKSRDTINDVALHELAHQWFGDLVTPLDFRHAWLTESFATFSEALWREELFGSVAYLNMITGKIDYYMQTVSKKEGVLSLYDFDRQTPSSNYPETIYQKGAAVLGMLRWHLGDSVFFGALRQYLYAHSQGNATTTNMKVAFETASGRDLTPFFDEWIYGKGWPKLAFTYIKNGVDYDVEARQVQRTLDPTQPVFTTLPLGIRYFDAQDRDVDTVLLPDATGTFRFSVKKVTGINRGTKIRSLLEVTQTVGVDESATNARRISISPNPTDNVCTIERTSSLDVAYVNIIDTSGRTLLTKVIEAGVSTSSFSVAELTDGAYIVHIVEAGQPLSLPLFITR